MWAAIGNKSNGLRQGWGCLIWHPVHTYQSVNKGQSPGSSPAFHSSKNRLLYPPPLSHSKSNSALGSVILLALLPCWNLRNLLSFPECSKSTSFMEVRSFASQNSFWNSIQQREIYPSSCPPLHWRVILSFKLIEFRTDHILMYHSSNLCQQLR